MAEVQAQLRRSQAEREALQLQIEAAEEMAAEAGRRMQQLEVQQTGAEVEANKLRREVEAARSQVDKVEAGAKAVRARVQELEAINEHYAKQVGWTGSNTLYHMYSMYWEYLPVQGAGTGGCQWRYSMKI